MKVCEGVSCAKVMLGRVLIAGAFAWCAIAFPGRAWAQACCGGAGAVTPGRLAVHEDASVGLQLKGADAFGSFGSDATYHGAPAKTQEWELEQDLFGALRVVARGQLALLVPLVQTYRKTPGFSSFGGGI